LYARGWRLTAANNGGARQMMGGFLVFGFFFLYTE
jgi:hypothetical protein